MLILEQLIILSVNMPMVFYQNWNYFLVRNKGQIQLVKMVKHCFVSPNNPTTLSLPITFCFFCALLQELHTKLVISLTTYCSAGDGQY